MAQQPHQGQHQAHPSSQRHPATAAGRREGAGQAERAADKHESADAVERTAAGQESAEERERAAARRESAGEQERAAGGVEGATAEERDVDAPVLPQILTFSLLGAGDPQLLGCVINLPLDPEGANLGARQKTHLVVARDGSEMQARALSALIGEFAMTQELAELALGQQQSLVPGGAVVELAEAEEGPVDQRAAMRA